MVIEMTKYKRGAEYLGVKECPVCHNKSYAYVRYIITLKGELILDEVMFNHGKSQSIIAFPKKHRLYGIKGKEWLLKNGQFTKFDSNNRPITNIAPIHNIVTLRHNIQVDFATLDNWQMVLS